MRAPLARIVTRYTLTYTSAKTGKSWEYSNLDRGHAASKLRLAREMQAEGMITNVDYTYETARVEYDNSEMHFCYGCQARESLWDMDCDGPYPTSECGKCDWWACVNARETEEHRATLRAWSLDSLALSQDVNPSRIQYAAERLHYLRTGDVVPMGTYAHPFLLCATLGMLL